MADAEEVESIWTRIGGSVRGDVHLNDFVTSVGRKCALP
jgi:hypothetical protein